MKLGFSRQIFQKSSNIKFNQNAFSGSQVVPRARTDGHDEAKTVAFRNFANAPYKTHGYRILLGQYLLHIL